jgi:hypothetical protein
MVHPHCYHYHFAAKQSSFHARVVVPFFVTQPTTPLHHFSQLVAVCVLSLAHPKLTPQIRQ